MYHVEFGKVWKITCEADLDTIQKLIDEAVFCAEMSDSPQKEQEEKEEIARQVRAIRAMIKKLNL